MDFQHLRAIKIEKLECDILIEQQDATVDVLVHARDTTEAEEKAIAITLEWLNANRY